MKKKFHSQPLFLFTIFFLLFNVYSFAQTVGISTTTPTAKLQINNNGSIRPTLKLFDSAANSGTPVIQFQNAGGSKFWQIGGNINDASPAGSFFDIYSSQAGAFLLTVKGNGNVGIGASSPDFILDVGGRMRVRSGSGSAGIWFNTIDNFSSAGFMGNNDDEHIGMYGNNGAGWSLVMNTTTGDVGIGNSTPLNKLDVTGNLNFTGYLKLNGSVGAANQLLQSNGVGTPPSWVSPTKYIYDNSIIHSQSGSVTSTSASFLNDIPNLTHTFIANGPVKAQISFAVNVQGVTCGACGASNAAIYIVVDGSQDCMYNNAFILNGNETTISGTFLKQLGFGSHTIKLQLRWQGGPSVAAFAPNPNNYLSVVLFSQ